MLFREPTRLASPSLPSFGGVLVLAFVYLAVLAAILLSRPDELDTFQNILPAALLLCFLYWQLIPVLMASIGSSLDLKKLLVYPIPHSALFTLEVILRVSTGVEMLLVTAGAGVGLLLNPAVPLWAPLALIPFVVFNLLCSAGIRDLLVRLLARKRVRESWSFCWCWPLRCRSFCSCGARVPAAASAHFFPANPPRIWPWTATARLALGRFLVAKRRGADGLDDRRLCLRTLAIRARPAI